MTFLDHTFKLLNFLPHLVGVIVRFLQHLTCLGTEETSSHSCEWMKECV